MKPSDLKVGRTYELATGQIAMIKRVIGKGRNRDVFLDCMLRWGPRPLGRYLPIDQFAELVARELPGARRRKATM